MTTHILKAGPIDDLRLRCGKTPKQAGKGALIAPEDAYTSVDCAACLHDVIREMKLAAVEQSAGPSWPMEAVRWLAGPDTGISSKTIFAAMVDDPSARGDWAPGIPHDPGDFGRCHRLLEAVPQWRSRMHEMSLYPQWRPLVEHWDELTALYLEELPSGTAPKLYARMKELTR